jgi:acyl dehydratase
MKIDQLSIGKSFENDDYILISQEQVQQFADATGDHQWIHLDSQRCATESPYKTTIAHGFLTVSLMPKLFAQCLEIDEKTTTMINYGMDQLRFIEAVRVNDEIKYAFTLLEIEEKPQGHLYKFSGEVRIKGREKPALVGTFLSLVLINR